MPITRRSLAVLAAGAALARPGLVSPAAAAVPLEQVATFDMQVTGVAVAPDGRMFVNFPRWEQDVPVSVAEVMKDGSIKPYPDAAWNSWSNLKPLSNADHFVCVQSVTVDPQGFLWVVDPAAPGNEFNLDGGPKLVKIDLKSNRVVKVIPFGRDVMPQGGYLNDVRVSPDGRTAYLTDSGVVGALLVVDVPTGKVRRVLSGASCTQVDKSVVVTTDGKPLRRPDNRGPAFAADGIALDRKGEYLYWQVLDGDTLYRIPTRALAAGMMPAKVEAAVQTLGKTFVSDGYWIDRKDRLFLTSPSDNSVKMRNPDGTFAIVVQDDRLRWPDSMAEGADGTMFVTSSHIQDMAQWHEKGSTRTMPYAVWRFRPA